MCLETPYYSEGTLEVKLKAGKVFVIVVVFVFVVVAVVAKLIVNFENILWILKSNFTNKVCKSDNYSF